MKKILSLLLLVVGMASCSNNEDLFDSNSKKTKSTQVETFKVSPEEAKEELVGFLNKMGTSSLTRSTTNKNIGEVQAIRNSFMDATTRSMSEEGDIDTLMYAINFADNQGFALVAADKRTSPVLAIIDEGSFNVDSLSEDKDEGFLAFIDNAINMEKEDIQNYSAQTRSMQTNGYVVNTIYSPILHTKWTQQDVYGQYCPNGIAGCTVIATAQILSYFKNIGHVNWAYNGTIGSSDLHWDKIISDCDSHDGKLLSSSCSTSANEVAHLVRYLGIAFGAKYNKKSTSVGESKAIDWFNKWGGLKASSLKGYNESAIVSAIKAGNPVYARGNSGKKKVFGIRVGWKGGHAWIYDGAIIASKDGKSNTFVHCNWGWGGYKNGYYLSNAFDTKAGATMYDSSDTQTGNTSNYKYNLEYSIITK